MEYILAIDQGTTGSRAIVYDKKGRQVASAYREFPQYFPRPGWVEHDPEEIWQSVNATVQKVLRKVPPASIAAIGITNQRETTVIWDKKTGRAVHRAIVWQCRRTAGRCDQLKRKGPDQLYPAADRPADRRLLLRHQSGMDRGQTQSSKVKTQRPGFWHNR